MIEGIEADVLNQQLGQMLRTSQATGHMIRLLDMQDPAGFNFLEEAIARGANLGWVSPNGVPLVLHAIKCHDRKAPVSGNKTAEQCLVDKLRPLLEADAPILRSPAGETPLSNVLIVLGDAPDAISLLLEHGADPNEATTGPALGVVDQAVSSGALQSLSRLLAAGATPDGLSGRSVMLAVDYHAAIMMRDTARKLVRVLLAAGANPDPQDPGEPGALFKAITGDLFGAALELLAAGANPDAIIEGRPDTDNTPFKHALNKLKQFDAIDYQTGQPMQMGLGLDDRSADGGTMREVLAAIEHARLIRDTPAAPGAKRAPRL